MNQKLSLIENEVSLGSIFNNELTQLKEKEKMFEERKNVLF